MKHYTVSIAVLRAARRKGERLADAATRAIRGGQLRECPETEPVRESQYRVTVQPYILTIDSEGLTTYQVRVYLGPGKTPRLISKGGWYA
jgi:hypothetical protein